MSARIEYNWMLIDMIYLLYQSTDPTLYTGTALPPSLLVESFSGVRGAGGSEAHRRGP